MRRSNIHPPDRYGDKESTFAFALAAAEIINSVDEPESYAEAKRSRQWQKWSVGCDEEMDSLIKNLTWVMVDKPENQKLISCKWLSKLKPGMTETDPPRYKARLVARGFTQREGIDYQEVFALVVKHVSIRMLLSVVVNLDLELEQMDIKTTFLHGNIEETLYISQPEGYEIGDPEKKVCLLKKSLYSLKQSPRQWNNSFDQFMITNGFKRSEHDPCVYTKQVSESSHLYLLLYVDDMLITAKEMTDVQRLKDQLSSTFE